MRRLAYIFIAAWFLSFAGAGLFAAFTTDDLMNLHAALTRGYGILLLDNLRFWSTAYRPLGALFYSTMYHVFGFHPLPFRAVCLLLLGFNLILLYRFCRVLSGSREAALIATLLASYHAWFIALYYNTGTIYDLLSFTFFFCAFLLYAGIRRKRALRPREIAILIALYVCALNAKEMAVTLPVFLLIYELLYCRPRTLLPTAITAALTAIYIAGKLRGPQSLAVLPAYHLTISPGRFLDAFHLYLNPLLYQDHFFRDSNTVQLLLLMLAIAIWRRSKPLLFAWSFLLLSILPVAFIAHYSAFFLYLPMAGWALYAGVALVMLRKALTKAEPASQIALFLAVAAFLPPFHVRETRRTLHDFVAFEPPIRETTSQMLAVAPHLKPGAHVLFVDDSFPPDDYSLLFLTRLLYHDLTITVDRTRVTPVPPSDYARYDAVFTMPIKPHSEPRPKGAVVQAKPSANPSAAWHSHFH